MFALTNYFTLTSKNITVWWQNKSSGLVVFKKRNGISPIKPSNFFFFFWVTTLLNSCWMKLFNAKVKPHFVHLLLWHEKCRAMNLIQYFFFIFRSICLSQNSCFLFVHNFNFQQIIIDPVLYVVFDMSEIS